MAQRADPAMRDSGAGNLSPEDRGVALDNLTR